MIKETLIILIAGTFVFGQETTVIPEQIEDSSSTACPSKMVEESNKKLVLDFYQELFGDKNISAVDKYVSNSTYIQHNPFVADGAEALKTAAKTWFVEGTQKEKIDVQHIGADGDLVWLHTKATWDGKIKSIMDIFKISDGKIVEHWDVNQGLPDKAANDHPLF